MADTPQSAENKRASYLQLMRQARQADDPILVRMIIRKLAGLGTMGAVTTPGGCTVIPFPATKAPAVPSEPEQPLWWVLLKLTLAIPGSMAALMLLSMYSYNKSWLP